MPKPPHVDQVSTSAPDLPLSEIEDRKVKILAFRSSILEWGKTSQPNTYTEFNNIKVYKALNSALYVTTRHKGKEFTEGQNSFFERLWVAAGLPPDAIPFKHDSTNGPSASDAGPSSLPVPPTTAKGTATQSASAVGHSGPVSTSFHTRIPPKTPRQRTLVDPITGAWRSSADADKKRLARDVMYALGKRKLDSVSHSSPYENPAKRQALDGSSTSGSVHRIAEPVTSSTSATTLSALQVTSQHSEQQPQPVNSLQDKVVDPCAKTQGQVDETTSKPVTVIAATNGISLEPSVQPIEPLPPKIVGQSASSPSQSKSRPVQNTIDLSNSQESHSFPTPSSSSLQNGDADETPSQVVRDSGSLSSEGPTTTPSLPLQTQSPAPVPMSLQQEPRDSALATSVKRPLIALPIVPDGILASSSIWNNQPSSSTKLTVAEPLNPPPNSQVKPDPPSSSQVEQDVTPPLLNLNVDSSGTVWPSGFDLSQEASSSKARLPLFLPSPSSSSSSLPSKKNKRSSSVYVLVPPPPEYLIRYRRQQRMKDELDNTRTSSAVSTFKTSRSLEGV